MMHIPHACISWVLPHAQVANQGLSESFGTSLPAGPESSVRTRPARSWETLVTVLGALQEKQHSPGDRRSTAQLLGRG